MLEAQVLQSSKHPHHTAVQQELAGVEFQALAILGFTIARCTLDLGITPVYGPNPSAASIPRNGSVANLNWCTTSPPQQILILDRFTDNSLSLLLMHLMPTT